MFYVGVDFRKRLILRRSRLLNAGRRGWDGWRRPFRGRGSGIRSLPVIVTAARPHESPARWPAGRATAGPVGRALSGI